MCKKTGCRPPEKPKNHPENALFYRGYSPLLLIKKIYQKSWKVDKSGHCFFDIVILKEKLEGIPMIPLWGPRGRPSFYLQEKSKGGTADAEKS